jgi:hypothetical protein
VAGYTQTALSTTDLDLESLLPDVWIAALPEQLLTYRRDEAEAAAAARRRRRARRREKAPKHNRSFPKRGTVEVLQNDKPG